MVQSGIVSTRIVSCHSFRLDTVPQRTFKKGWGVGSSISLRAGWLHRFAQIVSCFSASNWHGSSNIFVCSRPCFHIHRIFILRKQRTPGFCFSFEGPIVWTSESNVYFHFQFVYFHRCFKYMQPHWEILWIVSLFSYL